MTSITEKTCCRCKEIKPISEFGICNTSKDKHAYCCKACIKIQSHEWYEKHKEKVLETNKNWAINNPQKKKEGHDRWNNENRERIKESYEQWYFKNKEWFLENCKERYRKNPEKFKERTKKYLENNPDAKAKKRISQNKWGANNPEKVQMKTKNRRARKNENGGHLTAKEWRELLFEADYKCQKCGTEKDLTLDHIIPVLLGGRSEKENAQVLCRSCNSSKGIKIIDYRKMSQAALGVKNE